MADQEEEIHEYPDTHGEAETPVPSETVEAARIRRVAVKAKARLAYLGGKLERANLKTAPTSQADQDVWRTHGLRLALQMRRYRRGEDMQGIYIEGIHDPTDSRASSGNYQNDFVVDPNNGKSWVLAEDLKEGYIARSETDVTDQWYLSREFVERYYYPAYTTMGQPDHTK